MSRIVEEKTIPAGAGRFKSGTGAGHDVKDVLERVAKYVPAEIIAGYVMASGFAENAKHGKVTLLGIIFGVCLICTPIYILQWAKTRKERIANGVISTLAFVAWAYAYGGLFREIRLYDAAYASVGLVLVTIISGAVVPHTVVPPPKAEILQQPPPLAGG
jgi:hypothetical protein